MKIKINKNKIYNLVERIRNEFNYEYSWDELPILTDYNFKPFIVKKGGIELEVPEEGGLLYKGTNILDISSAVTEEITVTEKQINYIGENSDVIMYVGGTGTGKTYKAIHEAAASGKFTIAVPIRQLAYEIVIDYNQVDGVSTGEIFQKGHNFVVTYEELNNTIYYDGIKTLIIDEAHFLQDIDRGASLLKFIYDAVKASKDRLQIILLTATDSLSEELKAQLQVKVTELKPFKKIERQMVEDEDEFFNLCETRSTLVFTKFKPTWQDAEWYADVMGISMDKVGLIHADIPTSERIQTQLDFKSGKLQLVLSSNVLAQGVNFPAQCVLIEYNEWDNPEIIHQKMGRAGRPNLSSEAFIYCRYIPNIYKRNKNKTKVKNKPLFYKGIFIGDLDFEDFQIPNLYYNEYSSFKYSKGFLEYLENNNLLDKEDEYKLAFLRNEEKKLTEIIKKF